MSEVYKIQVNDSEPIEVSQQVYEVSFCFNEMLKEKDKEIERLNNIINELEEYIKWQRKCSLSLNNGFTVSRLDVVLNKLQELKGSDKE